MHHEVCTTTFVGSSVPLSSWTGRSVAESWCHLDPIMTAANRSYRSSPSRYSFPYITKQTIIMLRCFVGNRKCVDERGSVRMLVYVSSSPWWGYLPLRESPRYLLHWEVEKGSLVIQEPFAPFPVLLEYLRSPLRIGEDMLLSRNLWLPAEELLCGIHRRGGMYGSDVRGHLLVGAWELGEHCEEVGGLRCEWCLCNVDGVYSIRPIRVWKRLEVWIELEGFGFSRCDRHGTVFVMNRKTVEEKEMAQTYTQKHPLRIAHSESSGITTSV